jgi:hypothetical protein
LEDLSLSGIEVAPTVDRQEPSHLTRENGLCEAINNAHLLAEIDALSRVTLATAALNERIISRL